MNLEWIQLDHYQTPMPTSPDPHERLEASPTRDHRSSTAIRKSKLLAMVRKWRAQLRRRSHSLTPKRPSLLTATCSSILALPRCGAFSSTTKSSSDDDDGGGGGGDAHCYTDHSNDEASDREIQVVRQLGKRAAHRTTSCSSILIASGQKQQAAPARSSSCSAVCMSPALGKKPAATPRGYLAVYVGEERRRFLVKASFINHPLFVSQLLEKAREEFGFEQKGPLNIPCDISFFEHILLMVQSNCTEDSAGYSASPTVLSDGGGSYVMASPHFRDPLLARDQETH